MAELSITTEKVRSIKPDIHIPLLVPWEHFALLNSVFGKHTSLSEVLSVFLLVKWKAEIHSGLLFK